MKALKILILASMALFFLSVSCEKCQKPDPEPEFTEYFTCKINGEEWVAKTPASISGPVAIFVDYLEDSKELNITGTNKNKDLNIYEDIYIYVRDIENTGVYNIESIGGLGNPILCFTDVENTGLCSGFYYDSLKPGIVDIDKIDKERREITGSFYMNVIDFDCNDSIVKITDGKFAIRY